MGIFNRRRGIEERADGMIDADALLSALGRNPTANKWMALQVPTISGGIDLIAGIIASTPLKLYRDNDGKAEEVRGDRRTLLLNDDTGDTLNANEFWHAMIRDYFVGKGGYAFINKTRGKVQSIHYVDEEQVSVIKNTDPIFKDYEILISNSAAVGDGTDATRFAPYQFIKILRNSRDGAQGIPITEESSTLVAVAYQQLLMELAMARRGGNKKGFIKSEKRLDEGAMTALKNAWSNLYGNGDETALVLNNGIDFKECSETSAEMQLAENKDMNAREFAKIFHISPDAISGKGEDIGGLAKLAAIPLMKVIECALNRDFLLEREKGKLYWAFDTKELLKGEMADRFNAYKTALEANFMQIDEVRYAEDLEPLGLNWIKLGLQDVLYDPKSGMVYTPNTNQVGGLGRTALGAASRPAENNPENAEKNPENGGKADENE